MAKIISQLTMFDYTEIEALGDLERLKLALEGIDDEDLMRRLEKKRKRGRNDYPVRVMWNLLVAMKVYGHRTVASFMRELSRNAQLRRACGLMDNCYNRKHLVPPHRVFSNFLNLLADERAALKKIFENGVNELQELLPSFGKNIAGDGKYLDSYARSKKKDGSYKSGRRGEHDASWHIKEYTYTDDNGKKHTKKETHYGFKAHIICDVATELPMQFAVTKASADEKSEMSGLLKSMPLSLKERAESFALDRGYDSTNVIKAIKNEGIAPVVDIRNCWKDKEETKQYKETDIVYNYKGEVFYVTEDCKQVKMAYKGYDNNKKCLRYSHCGKIYKIYISFDTRVFLPIARDSIKFKKLYKGRTSIERLNGRIDRDMMFEDHCIRGLSKMRTLLTVSFIIMNAMAISKIKSGQEKRLAAFTQPLKKAG